MRTDRKKDLDKYYNDHLKMHIVRRLMMVETWSEIKGIQSAVFEALDREDKAEQLDKAGVAEARRQQQNGELSDVLECYMSLVQQLCAAVKVCLSTAHTCRPLPWPQQPFPS